MQVGKSVKWPVLGLLSTTVTGQPVSEADHLVAESDGVAEGKKQRGGGSNKRAATTTTSSKGKR